MEQYKNNKIIQQVRYSNDLITFDIAQMNALSQNLLSFLFWRFLKEKKSSYVFTYDEIKKALGITRRGNKVLDETIFPNVHEIIRRMPRIEGENDKGRWSMVLMPWFQEHKDKKILEIELNSHFWEIFGEYLDYMHGFTSYKLDDFLKIKSKWSKNLYRLFRRNFKGVCTISNEDIRFWMGMTNKMASKEVVRIVKKAAEDLLQKKLIMSYSIETHYSTHGLETMTFHYTFPMEESKKENSNFLPVSENDLNLMNNADMDRMVFIRMYERKIGNIKYIAQTVDEIQCLIDKYGITECLQAIDVMQKRKQEGINYLRGILKKGVNSTTSKDDYPLVTSPYTLDPNAEDKWPEVTF